MARSVSFTGPREVAVRETTVPDPGPGELAVETEVSAVSPGTELLVYRGEFPEGMGGDETIDALSEPLSFPLSYGYAAVGTVSAVGEGVDEAWLDRRAFAFHPHAGRFVVPVGDAVALPPDLSTRAAALLPNVETAVNFLLDGAPRVGERVAVFGQGVVGLLTTALLARCPLADLVTFDLHERRRSLSTALGADAAVDPTATDPAAAVARAASAPDPPGLDAGRERVDLAYELSGNPAALDDAVAVTGYDGRVVVGSWYGSKPAELDLGGRYHRSRIDIESSQVSTVDPALRGRWDDDRRLSAALSELADLPVERLVTHEVPVEEAPRAYELLDEHPDEAVQVLLTY